VRKQTADFIISSFIFIFFYFFYFYFCKKQTKVGLRLEFCLSLMANGSRVLDPLKKYFSAKGILKKKTELNLKITKIKINRAKITKKNQFKI
jgi:hypothetical protein